MSQGEKPLFRAALPVLLGAGLFAFGLYALFHLLRPVHFADVMLQIRAMPLSALLLALGSTTVGYAALMAYDWFGLRFIGRKVDGGLVALSGFLGSAFGNTIGISVVSGGAVRYRLYSSAGLGGLEVAALSAYIAMALGTGLTLVGLAAVSLRPDLAAAVLPITADNLRWGAGTAVLLAAAAIVWMSSSGRSFALGEMTLRLPRLPDLAGQMLVTLVDIAAAAFALWILMPDGKPDYASFLAIFSAATMIGVLSHVPGGVGVFETVVITALPASVPVQDAAAALLLFRIIYYLLPFTLAFLLVAANEARSASGPLGRLLASLPALPPVISALRGLSPGLVATVAFGFGAYLLLVTMVPSVRANAMAENDFVGTLLLEGGTLASAVAGGLLLVLSHGLARRVTSAFLFTIGALLMGALAALMNDFDARSALFLLFGAAALWPFRPAFDRPGRLTEGVFEPRWFATVLAVALATAAFFFFVHKTVPYSNDLWAEFSRGSNTPRALRAGLAATAVLFFFGIYMLTRPARVRPQDETDPEAEGRRMKQAAMLCDKAQDPQAWLSQTGDKRFLFSPSGRSFIMYAVRGGSWVALGDPVGEADEFQALCWSFADLAARHNGRAVFYEVSARNLPLWLELGLSLNKIGEEAVVNLPSFTMAGGKFKAMRAALSKRQREGFEVAILPPPHDAGLMEQLQAISESWLGDKTGREKGFSVGRFDPDYLQGFPIAVVRKSGQTVAFANILIADSGRTVSVDLMRYLPEEASGLMEYLFLCLIEHYRDQGAQEFSLGMAPLSGLSEQSVARSWNRFARLIYRHGGAFYNFEGLRAFKQKFGPDWRPRYFALPPHVSPMAAMGDVALLIAGSTRGLVGK